MAIGLAGACLVTALMAFGQSGEIVLGKGMGNESRLWLIQDGAEAGIGLSWVRPVSSSRPDVACERTMVYFLLWKASGPKPSISYCECYRITPTAIDYEGACPP